jgi:hypothetical protein
MVECECARPHDRRRVVLTGGPGAGKTAVLELVMRSLCRHVKVLPEAAGIVFGGGFPRAPHETYRRAGQRAIFHVQRELEITGDVENPAIVLCDRGTLDGLAYWPGAANDFWRETGTSLAAELARYDVVLHLRTPSQDQGYNQQNPLRTEPAGLAAEIDGRILDVWQLTRAGPSSKHRASSSRRHRRLCRSFAPNCPSAARPIYRWDGRPRGPEADRLPHERRGLR